MPKWLKTLAMAALVLAALYGLTRLPRHAAFAAPAVPEKVAKVEVTGPKGRVVLEAEGDAWRLTAPMAFAADAEAVKALLGALRSLEAGEGLTRRAESYDTYQITDSSGVTVRLWATGSKEPLRWVFGKMAPDYEHIYVRFNDQPDVRLGRGVNREELDKPLTLWRDRRVVQAAAGDTLTRIAVERKKDPFVLEKSSDIWTLNGKATKPGVVDPLAANLTVLSADDFIDPPEAADLKTFGLQPPQSVVRLTFQSGKTVALALGKEDEATKRVPLRKDEEPVLFWLAQWRAKELLASAKDFLP